MLWNSFSSDYTNFSKPQSKNLLAATNQTSPYTSLRSSLDGLVEALVSILRRKGRSC